MRKAFSWLLILIPLLYYFALFAGAATYPGYSYVTNYASELGAAEAPFPALFNVSIMLSGVAALVAAVLLPGALRTLAGAKLWSALAALALGLWGVSIVMGGAFPMPNPLHGAFGLGLAGPLVPLFLLLALRRVPGMSGIRWFLGVIFLASTVMLAIMFGVGDLVTRANVGLWQRANMAASIPWLAIFGLWLMQSGRSRHDAAI